MCSTDEKSGVFQKRLKNNTVLRLKVIGDMHFGLTVINAWSTTFQLELAMEAEKAGWDGFFLWDHLMFDWDPWVLLGAVAAVTEKMRLGTLVTPLPRRRPQEVAKQTVTLDHLSKGRAVLGVGLGGNEQEFSEFGEESDARIRAEKLDEALEVITKLWSEKQVEHYGEHYVVDKVGFTVKPVQKPRIPIWVGGNSKPALRRASRYDGWFPECPSPSADYAGISVEELKDSIAFILKNRSDRRRFEILYAVETDDNSRPTLTMVRRLWQLGITWVLENVQGLRFSEDEALERIKLGPPRI